MRRPRSRGAGSPSSSPKWGTDPTTALWTTAAAIIFFRMGALKLGLEIRYLTPRAKVVFPGTALWNPPGPKRLPQCIRKTPRTPTGRTEPAKAFRRCDDARSPTRNSGRRFRGSPIAQTASSPVSPVRMRITCATSKTKIFPSPIFPV